MKIEKISDGRIKVTLQPNEMQKWNVTYDTLSTDNPETNNMFWDIILKIAEETGMDFKNCRLTVEVVRIASGSCVLIISKKELQTRYKYKIKQTAKEKTTTAIYTFKELDHLIEFTKNNLYYCFLFDGKNSLYRYMDELVLVITVLPELKKYVQAFNDRICEYAEINRKSGLYATYLGEHVKPIIGKNALKILYYKL